jgi:hypothetical protein
VHAVDVVHDVDPERRNTQRSHPGRLGEGLDRLLREFWIAELVESLRDTLGVLRTGLNENVDVLRRAGATVDGHRVCPDDDELSVVALE